MKECFGLYDWIISWWDTCSWIVQTMWKTTWLPVLLENNCGSYLSKRVTGNNTYLQTGFPSPEMKKLEIESQDWETTETP
jgi:hypothetical protein